MHINPDSLSWHPIEQFSSWECTCDYKALCYLFLTFPSFLLEMQWLLVRSRKFPAVKEEGPNVLMDYLSNGYKVANCIILNHAENNFVTTLPSWIHFWNSLWIMLLCLSQLFSEFWKYYTYIVTRLWGRELHWFDQIII